MTMRFKTKVITGAIAIFAILSLLFVFGAVMTRAGAALNPLAVRYHDMRDVECYANPSSFLIRDGWLRLYEVDRMTVARLVGEGRAEMKWEQSLICHDLRKGKGMDRAVVTELWWRRT